MKTYSAIPYKYNRVPAPNAIKIRAKSNCLLPHFAAKMNSFIFTFASSPNNGINIIDIPNNNNETNFSIPRFMLLQPSAYPIMIAFTWLAFSTRLSISFLLYDTVLLSTSSWLKWDIMLLYKFYASFAVNPPICLL